MTVSFPLRLSRLLSELEEIEDQGQAHFGFGVLVRADQSGTHRAPSGTKEYVPQSQPDTIRLRPSPWTVQSPTGDCRVRWWGDRDGVRSFEPWVVRFANLLSRRHDGAEVRLPTTVEERTSTVVASASETDFPPVRHSSDALLNLVTFAAKREALRQTVDVVSDDGETFYDVRAAAIRFVRAVAAQASTGPDCRLIVNTVTKAVTFDGHTTFPDESVVRVLYLLQQAKGVWISRSDLKLKDREVYPEQPILECEGRLERLAIKTIRKDLKIPLISSGKGYILPVDCLITG